MCRRCQASASARARIPLQPRLQGLLDALPTAPVLEDDLVGTGASDPSAEAVNSVALSFSEQGLLQPLLALHIPDRNQILNTIHAPEFNPEDIRFKNAAQLDELLSSMHTEVGLLAHTLPYNACPTYD